MSGIFLYTTLASAGTSTPSKQPSKPKEKTLVLTRKWLKEHDLTWESLTWEGLSEALFGDKKYADQLKKLNYYAPTPREVPNGNVVVDLFCSVISEHYCVPRLSIDIAIKEEKPEEEPEVPAKKTKKNGKAKEGQVFIPEVPETPEVEEVEEAASETEMKVIKKNVVYSGKSAQITYTMSKGIDEDAEISIVPQKGSGIELAGGENVAGDQLSFEVDLSQMDPAPEGGWKIFVNLDGKPLGAVKIRQE